MNNSTTEPEPITGSGIAWAITQIQKRFEKISQLPPSEEKEPEEQGDHEDR
jgi:hypothetical protein